MTFLSEYNQCWLKTIDNPNPQLEMKQTHIIELPILCPKSQNPAYGSTLLIEYQAGCKLLELFSLEEYIKGFIAHSLVRDIEHFVQVVGSECAKAIENSLTIEANISFNNAPPFALQQRQKIHLSINVEAN